MIDAAQVTQESNTFRPFGWNKLLDELYSDWRPGYTLAVLVDLLYGAEACPISEEVRLRLHRSFSSNPIPGPVKGHFFAYDIGGANAGEEQVWRNCANSLRSTSPEQDIISSLNKWPADHAPIVQAARIYMGNRGSVDLESLASGTSLGWKHLLSLMLYTEVLYGEAGSASIPVRAKIKFSEEFVESRPGEGLGKKIFPERF